MSLEGSQHFLSLIDIGRIRILLRHFQQSLQVFLLHDQALKALDVIFQRTQKLHLGLCLLGIIPGIGFFHFLMDLFYTLFFVSEVKVSPSFQLVAHRKS